MVTTCLRPLINSIQPPWIIYEQVVCVCVREKEMSKERRRDYIVTYSNETKLSTRYMVLCYAKLAERKQRYWWQYRYIVSSIIVWYIVDWYGPDRAFLSLRSGQQTILCASIEFPCFRSYRTCDEYMANWAKSLSFFLFSSPVKGYNQRLYWPFFVCVFLIAAVLGVWKWSQLTKWTSPACWRPGIPHHVEMDSSRDANRHRPSLGQHNRL